MLPDGSDVLFLNGHIVPSQVLEGITIGLLFIVAAIGLIVKERRLTRVKVA